MSTNKSVWLVYTDNIYFDSLYVYSVCSSFLRAKQSKKELEEQIEKLKGEYFIQYSSFWEGDLELLSNEELVLTDEKRYDLLTNRITLFRAKHKLLEISEITIQEHELLD